MKRKKKEECKENQTTTINIFGFTFHINNFILLKNLDWKKAVYAITFLIQFLRVEGYLKQSNNTPKFKCLNKQIII